MTDRSWSITRLAPQDGRTIVITGANSGLGFASAAHLAGAGAHLVMACRNRDKANHAADRLRVVHPRCRIDVLTLDLADLASVRRFVDEIALLVASVDVLMNNAGVMATDRGMTVDGFETQFGTNHLGHFALTGLMIPLLAANADCARIVNVSSMGHRVARLDLRDPNFEHRRYQRWGAYFQSKLANLLFTAELHRRLTAARSPVQTVAAHPGTATTELGKTGRSATNFVVRHGFGAVVRGPAVGSHAQVRAAVDPSIKPGSLVGPRWIVAGPTRLETPSRRARSADDARALWELSEGLTGVTFPV